MQKIYYSLVFLGMALALLVIADFELQNDNPEIVFLDIGQGDAILLQQGTTQILIDGGPGAEVVQRLGEYMPFWDRTIELVILSHAHGDHYAGLIDVFDLFTVQEFMWSGAVENADDFDVFMEMMAREDCEVILAAADLDMRLGSIILDFLYPFTAEQFLDQHEENLNNTSIVIRAVGPNISVMLTGDAEVEVEEELIDNNVFVQADILKAGHHGSKTSSCEQFIKAVSPDRATFHAGENNKFNHPADLVVARYQDLGIETFTLWQTGDIKENL